MAQRGQAWQNVATPVMDGTDSLSARPGGDIPMMESSATIKTYPYGGNGYNNSNGQKPNRRKWLIVGVVLIVLAIAGGVATFFALKKGSSDANSASGRDDDNANNSTSSGSNSSLSDSSSSGSGSGGDDDEIGNPKAYPPSTCELPNYLSKNGHIVAVSANGTEVPLKMKGINWFGMEAAEAIPLGLWDNSVNGTTVFKLAEFLETNKFNSVRLPVMATYLLDNKAPNTNLMNTYSNRALNATTYMGLLKGLVKALQYRNIGVLISMHTLTAKDKGALWYNEEVTEDRFLESIDLLTSNLCSMEYWNVMGIDLKNEPSDATWGDDTAKDFRAGALRIAERMLKGCPSWMGFVEGIYTKHEMVLDGEKTSYFDWYGGGLQGAKTQSLEFSVKDKLVWAPHYYTPAVFPQQYLFGGGTLGGEGTKGENGLMGYVELDDDKLRGRIKATMDDMFGFLASETGPAIVLGEFGGIYSTDAHPKKTTKRCTDFSIEIIKQPGWAGGFVWSLNPESEYQYNPADKPGRFFEGVLQDDWINANTEYLKGLAAMDTMENLRPFPCFPANAKTA